MTAALQRAAARWRSCSPLLRSDSRLHRVVFACLFVMLFAAAAWSVLLAGLSFPQPIASSPHSDEPTESKGSGQERERQTGSSSQEATRQSPGWKDAITW